MDGFDYMVYSFIIPTLFIAWHLSAAQAGTIVTGALLASAVGGWAAGMLADRFGRVRVLAFTVLWFALLTAASGFTRSYHELLLTRSLQGLGFGGEWAVGSVLLAESIETRHRGKALGLAQSSWTFGWAGAACAWALIYALVPAELAWRILFWIGLAPALWIAGYVRLRVPESPAWSALAQRSAERPRIAEALMQALAIFRAPLRRTTLLASLLCCGMLSAYYSVTSWLPTYLKNERHLSVLDTSSYMIVLIAGSFAGYLAGAWASDALGRRRCFILYATLGAMLVLSYMGLPITDRAMLVLGFPLGFFLSGIFSGSGAFLAELFPGAMRGSGQGFCYSIGRAVSAFCPTLIGVWSTHAPLAVGIGAFAAAGYGLVIVAALLLPETRGRALEA
jgi:MFS family permease